MTSLRPRTSTSLRSPGAISRAGATTYFAKFSFPISGLRDFRDRRAADDRCTADVLGLRLFLRDLQHVENAVAWNKADTAVVGDHKIAGLDPHLANLHRAVDFDGFEPPFAGDWADLTRPHRIADDARMGDIADTAHYDGAGFALALAGQSRNAAHVGHIGNALDHQYVAGVGKIVGFELPHAVDVVAGALKRVGPLQHVAHRKRRPHYRGSGNRRLEHRRADHTERNAQFVHSVGDQPGRIADCQEAVDGAVRGARRHHQADAFRRDAAGQALFHRVAAPCL